MTPVPSSPESEPKTVKIFSSHDPACDQCRIKKIGCGRELPSCSNCLRAKVQCVRSNKGKRPNQTNKLVGDFEQFGNRLGELEKNVNRIHERLDEFLRSLPSQQENSLSFLGHEVGAASKSSAIHDAIIVSSPTSHQDLLLSHVTSDGSIAERLIGTSSLVSLLEDADDKINLQLDSMRPRASIRDILIPDGRQMEKSPPPIIDAFMTFKADIYRGLSLSSSAFHADLSNDGSPLLLPPKRLLEPIVEPYFRHISAVVPIIGRVPCLEAIDQYYSSETRPESIDPAWIVLFNYMILFCFVGKYMPLERPSSDIDMESITHFEQPFITNIRRAFAVTDKLLTPKLVNVQALIALILISQRYFSEHVTQYLMNQACFVAKSMGLHRQKYTGGELAAEDIDARRRIFWCLFTIDKDVSLLLGTPPNLHHYDCDVPYPIQVSYDLLRRLDASLILGKVYIMLYSASAGRAATEMIEHNIDELVRDLAHFQRAVDIGPTNDTDPMKRAWQFLVLEHKHTIHHARLMVLRRSSQRDKYEQRLSEARQCIKMITRLHVVRTTVGGFMVLRRPFQWRPFASFFELLPGIFKYPITCEQLDDLSLLKELVDMLRVVASSDQPLSYCGKLLRITSGCIAIADEFIQQSLRHQNAASADQVQPINLDQQRKRRASNVSVLEVRAGKSRSPLDFSQQTRYPHLQGPAADVATTNPLMQSSIQPVVEAPDYMNMGYDGFGNNNLPDMFPGWPRADPDSLSFLTDGFFWGGEEIYHSLQHTPPQ